MDSPTNSFSGLSPEFNQLSSSESCSYSPIVIDLADSTVLVDTFAPEAIERVVSDLHSGQLVHVASSKGLTLYTVPIVLFTPNNAKRSSIYVSLPYKFRFAVLMFPLP